MIRCGLAEVLTLRELAAFLRISERTAYSLVERGDVPAVKVGGQWRIMRGRLEEHLDRNAA